jgi:hypothetical protein
MDSRASRVDIGTPGDIATGCIMGTRKIWIFVGGFIIEMGEMASKGLLGEICTK